jgi:hypothetical protein
MYFISDGKVISGKGIFIGTIATIAVGFIVFYLLLSFGFYAMAKRRKIDKPYLAFVPFVRWLIGGKIVKKAVLFGRVTEKIGLIATITVAVSIFFTILSTVCSYLVLFKGLESGEVIVSMGSISTVEDFYIMPIDALRSMTTVAGELTVKELPEIYSATTLISAMPKWFFVISIIVELLDLVATFARLFVMFGFWSAFYRLYKPNSIFMYTIVSALAPHFTPFFEIAGIFVFIFRNREEVNIEEMMRNMYRAQGYSNPYNNSYNNPYQNSRENSNFDPYGRDNMGNGTSKPNQDDDPFSDDESEDPFT